MNFTCDSCQRRYTIADEKVRGKTVKVRCRHCGNLVAVTGPGLPPEERTTMMPLEQVEQLRAEQRAAAAAAKAPAPGASEWFVMVKGKQVGPLDLRGLGELARVGEATGRSYLWRKGMADWKRAEELEAVAALFSPRPAAAPPAPPAAPPSIAPTPALASPRRAPLPQGPAAPAPSGPELRKAPTPFGRQPAADDDEPFQSSAPTAPAQNPLKPFEDEPAGGQGQLAARAGPSLDELFSDADLPDAPEAPGKAAPQRKVDDPFSSLPDIDPDKLPPIGEATRFFIAQAGVNKRNPPWKIAAFIVVPIALVAGALYALSTLNIVPLKVKRVDASGHEVEQSVFSGEGISALGDLLMGKNKQQKPKAQQQKQGPIRISAEKDPDVMPASGANMPTVGSPSKHEPTADELAALYGDSSKRDKGPRIRRDTEQKAQDTSAGGLSDEQVAKVVAQSQPAFQSCIEQALRKNPSLRVPRFYIQATVSTNGVVRSAVIDRKEIDSSSLGECLKARARRMVFAQFSGEELEIEIPLLVGVSM